jgi:hypothetical protein
MMNAALMTLASIAMMRDNMAMHDHEPLIPRRLVDVSKPATLTPKQWRHRKRRLSMASHSRKQNRS